MTSDKPSWDPFTPRGTQEATSRILTGRNYRLFYEAATRRTLIQTYGELTKIARKHPKDDEAWREHVRELVSTGELEDRRMRQWLIGLTRKTAQNLGVTVDEYPKIFDEMMTDIAAAVSSDAKRREMALLLWCGTATLTIRGSQKARIGKSLERSIARAALTAIGLNENNGDFRLNVSADAEVDREMDAEVRTARGFVQIEVGLIGEGNPEVIGDKVGRMSRNSIILMDKIPARSNAYRTAEHRGVKLIQLRNNNPVEEIRQHLDGLGVSVRDKPITIKQVEKSVLRMPLSAFARN